jgi:hypothetical protein
MGKCASSPLILSLISPRPPSLPPSPLQTPPRNNNSKRRRKKEQGGPTQRERERETAMLHSLFILNQHGCVGREGRKGRREGGEGGEGGEAGGVA